MRPGQMLQRDLSALADRKKAAILQGFFKTAPGQYGAGDIFLGLTVPQQRQAISRYLDLPLTDIKILLASPIHEFRLSALLILVKQYQLAPNLAEQKKIADFYQRCRQRVNNWDLVDASAPYILGAYLLASGQGIGPLLKLAESRRMWDRRIAMVSTLAFIKAGRQNEVFILVEKLMTDSHDLIHKAMGWMLRESGRRVSEPGLRRFLNRQGGRLPRTALRYAIERLSPKQRSYYLKRKKVL